jgi:hypothetical protein
MSQLCEEGIALTIAGARELTECVDFYIYEMERHL